MPFDNLTLPLIGREASVLPDSIDPEAREIEIVWTTGARVTRGRWEGWDDYKEYEEELEVSPGAIRLERMNSGAPFLDSHRSWGGLNAVLGNIVEGSVRIANGHGTARVRLTSAPDAADVVHRILEKTVRFVSVGYRVHKYEIEKRDGQREIWRAVDWEPYEVSAVSMPADAGSVIRSAEGDKGAQRTAPCQITYRNSSAAAAAITRKGAEMPNENDPAADDQRRAAEGNGNPAAAGAVPPAGQPAAGEERAAAQRLAVDVLTICQRHGQSERAADFIARGLTLDQVRAQILDSLAADGDQMAGRRAPAQAQGQPDNAFRDAMASAILHRVAPAANQPVPAAREFMGRRLMELARISLERSGVDTRGMAQIELAGLALGERSSAGYHVTTDFPVILAGVINRTLRAAYDGTPRTFTAWAAQKTIADFRQVERVQLGGAPDLVKVPEGGKFSYGTMGEGKEVYALSTYGKIIAFSRQMLINDDLSAFDRIPQAFGASAADLESDIVYAILMGNPTMGDGTALFHADHGNLGTAAIISETSLSEAYRKFAQQKGLEGRPISVLPQFILTPPGPRSVQARKQVAATTPNSTSDVNPYAGRLQVIEEPRLIPASGQDPWFMAASPSRIDTLEYAYLEGQQGIYTETRMGFGVDGLEIKARHDFAAKAIDWRGLFKNAGAAS